ncbi:MAG: PEP-CTERM sorting domain-containing protein [Planctomycetota bacterium]
MFRKSIVVVCALLFTGFGDNAPRAVAGVIPPDIMVNLQYAAYNNADASFDASTPTGFASSGLPLPTAEQLVVRGFAAPDRFITSTGSHTLLLTGNPGQGPAVFTMTADIDESGDLLGGSFDIMGDDPFVSPDATVSLLNGTFTNVQGALTTAGILEFEASSIGGAFAGLFGSEVVIKIGGLSTGNSFLNDFFLAGLGTANVGRPVPEPTTFAMWGLGMGALVLRRRRR